MSLSKLSDRIASFRKKVDSTIDSTVKEIEEAEKILDREEVVNVKEVYNLNNLPDRIKKFPLEKRKQWMEVFNSAFLKYKDEGRAFRIANGTVKENTVTSKKSNEERDLNEQAPMGSFEDVKEEIEAAIKALRVFDGYGYVMYTYPEYVICMYEGQFYRVNYQIDMDGNITLGAPEKVEQYFTPSKVEEKSKGKQVKEAKSVAAELKESGIVITKQAVEMDLDVNDFISLKEANYDESTGEVEVILIEAGTNKIKKRHYPESTIKEAAPLFSGLKMYINHQTAKEEMERPERDLKDWCATIVESHYDNGKAIGRVAVHDNWLRDRLKDSVARAHIGVSINAGGKISYGKINGEEMQIIEKILFSRQNGPVSVDWVTEAGARGRVSRLLKESQTSKEKKGMELKEATFEDLKKENPQLVEAAQAPIKKQLDDLQAENKVLKEKDLKESQKSKVVEWIKESKLPQITKDRICVELSSVVFENETKLREAFESKVKSETEYLSKIDPKGKISLGAGSKDKTESVLKESVQASIEKRMGLDKKKKDEEEE